MDRSFLAKLGFEVWSQGKTELEMVVDLVTAMDEISIYNWSVSGDWTCVQVHMSNICIFCGFNKQPQHYQVSCFLTLSI